MTVASLGYLHIGIMVGSGEMAIAVTQGLCSFTQIGKQLLIVELAIKLVYLWKLLFELVLITLGKTPHDKQFVELASFLPFYKTQNGVDTFLFGTLYKATGVDDGYLALRPLGIMCTPITIGFKLLHELFGIYKVLRTTHSDDIYLIVLQLNLA